MATGRVPQNVQSRFAQRHVKHIQKIEFAVLLI